MEAAAGVARAVRLLLDEMHAPAVADALTADGWDVVAVAANPSLRGTSDEELLAYATAEGRALVTENIVDFAVIAARWAAERARTPDSSSRTRSASTGRPSPIQGTWWSRCESCSKILQRSVRPDPGGCE